MLSLPLLTMFLRPIFQPIPDENFIEPSKYIKVFPIAKSAAVTKIKTSKIYESNFISWNKMPKNMNIVTKATR